MMRAREIQTILQGKIDPALIKILTLMAEDNMMLKQQNAALATSFTQLASMMQMHTDILAKVREIQDLRHGLTEAHKSINAADEDQDRAMHELKKGD